MSSLSPEMTPRVSSSGTVAREKCSRNKRKFRQDPPFQNQGSTDENHSCGSNAGTASLSDGESWVQEPRSTESATTRTSCADSSRKEFDGGANSCSGKNDTVRFYQENLKLMRWFRSGQGRSSQAGCPVVEGKLEHPTDGHSKVSDASEEDEEFYELEEVDWDDCTEGELEELLVKSLGSLYNEATNKIVACGHSGDDALRAVLKQGRCYGGKDAVSNIVENALAYLTGKKQHATEGRDHSFSDLKELQKYGVGEMVGRLREVRPLISKGDAMWRLLMCDMNVALASVMEDSALPPLSKEPANHIGQAKAASSSSPPLPRSSERPVPASSSPDSSNSPSAHLPDAAFLTPPDATHVLSVPSTNPPIAVPLSPTSSSSSMPSVPIAPDVSLLSSSGFILHSISSTPAAETSSNFQEPMNEEGPRQVSSTTSASVSSLKEEDEEVKEAVNSTLVPAVASLELCESAGSEDVLDTESDANESVCDNYASAICEASSELHLITAELSHGLQDESCEDDLEKSSLEQGFVTLSSSEEPPVVNLQADHREAQSVAVMPLEIEKSLDSGSPTLDANLIRDIRDTLDHSNCAQSDNSGPVIEPEETVSCTVKFGSVDDETSTVSGERDLSSLPPLDAESSCSGDVTSVTEDIAQAAKVAKLVPECCSKEASLTWKGEEMGDQKDEMIVILKHRTKDLETQLQERTEWAKQKVMQAARRLSKDLQELKGLRLEREEALRLKKDKQALEDSTVKKVTDLEKALGKARGEVDLAKASVRKLEAEIAEVRAEMEATKLSAAETLSSCQEMAKRERKYTKRAQAWEKQKAKFQEDLSDERRKITALQQQLVLAKERQQQAEVRWRQEEKAKEDATLRADHEKRVREQAETAAKKREESFRRKAESTSQRHREEVQRLESEISQFRTSAEAAQLATSRWGPGVAVAPHMMELGTLQALKEHNNRLSREIAELQDMARRDVRRERECVMCMCEEMSVVFLPCAHQVVCVKCNELHEKQGMRDCPSCRTPIKQRIRVYVST